MQTIAVIKDEDIGEVSKISENPKVRIGARGVVMRGDGKIALFYEENKGDYKLPGGGLEGDEDPKQTFVREVYEEVGCEIQDIKEIATIEEHRSQANFKQISHVFVARLKKDLSELHLTAKERVWGGKMLWVKPEEAIKLIEGSFNKLKNLSDENLYHVKFMVTRDFKILEYILSGEHLI